MEGWYCQIMMSNTALANAPGDPIDYALAAWLHAKSTRTGSAKTERAYRDTLQRFRWALQQFGLDLDADTARVADVAQAWASTPWDGRRQRVTANTYNQRLAIVSSFYAFTRKRRLLQGDNPIELVERRPVHGYAGARPLDSTSVAESLAAIDRTAPDGKRDFALLALAFYTGRRLSELAHLRCGDVRWERGRATLHFAHAKGGKELYDTLPAVLSQALADYVTTVHGPTPGPETRLWISLAHHRFGHPLSKQGIANICFKHLGVSKVHVTRHTFAHSMEQVGAKLSDIQARLGHSNAATTSKYLAALRSAENDHGDALAALLGLVD
jgi:site-specific recombinase XerD